MLRCRSCDERSLMSEETQHKSSHMHILVITAMLFSLKALSQCFCCFYPQRGNRDTFGTSRYRQCECEHSWTLVIGAVTRLWRCRQHTLTRHTHSKKEIESASKQVSVISTRVGARCVCGMERGIRWQSRSSMTSLGAGQRPSWSFFSHTPSPDRQLLEGFFYVSTGL